VNHVVMQLSLNVVDCFINPISLYIRTRCRTK